MRKHIGIAILLGLVIFMVSSCATSRESNFSSMKALENYYQTSNKASSHVLPGSIIKMLISKNSEMAPYISKVEKVKILTLDGLSKRKENQLKKDLVNTLSIENYEDTYSAINPNGILKFAGKTEDGIVKDMIFLAERNKSLLLIQIESKLTPEDLNKLMEMINKKKVNLDGL